MAINVGTAYIEILPSTNKLAPHIRQALGDAERDSKRSGERSGKGFASGFGGQLKGAIGVGLVAGLAGFTAAAINTRAQFGKTMNTVQGVTNIGAGAMARLEKQAIDMGKSTVFSANEAADAMLELAKAGIKPADIEAGALKGTLKLAAAAGTDMATAATIAGNAMNTFGLKGRDMNKVANALAGGANASTASVESLGEALSQVGPGASNAGLSLNDTVGVLAAFDSAGIKGSDAGTSLKTMLANLVPQTDKAKNKMRELGLEFTNADGSFRSITDISGQLQKSIGGLSESARTDTLNTLFGSDASRAAAVLMKEGADGIGKYIKATKDKKAADRAAEAGMKGLAGAIERVKGAWETFMLQYGSGLEKGAIVGLKIVEGLINGLGPAITKVGEAIGGTITWLSEAVAFVVKFRKAFMITGAIVLALFAPWIAQMAIVNAQFAIMILRETILAARTKLVAAAHGLYNITLGAWVVLAKKHNLQSALMAIRTKAATAAINLAVAAQWLWNAAIKAAGLAKHLVLTSAMAIKTVAVTAATKAWTAAQLLLNLAIKGAGLAKVAITTGLLAAKQFLIAAATKAWAIAQRLLNLALKANPLGLVIAAIALAVGAFILLYKHNEGFRKLVQKVWGAVKTWIVDTWKNHIKPALKAFGGWITGTLIPVLKRLWTDVVKPTFAAIGRAIKFAWDKVIKPAFSAMRFYLTKVLFPVLRFLWNNVVKPVFKGIGNAISFAWKNLIKPAFSRMASTVRGLVAAFRFAKDGIVKVWSAIKASIAKPINFVINTIWNDGLREVLNAIPGVKKMGRAADIPGYADGGWTGPGGKFKPAGVVHADEFVVSKAARRNFEKKHPGALDHLNNYGELPGYASGGLVWPTTGRNVSTYAGHDGVDINGNGEDYGNPIFAFRDGTISYVGSGRGYGAPAIFQRTSVGEVVYGHASSAAVQAGQSVKAGQVIGRIGSTGNSSGPHLHFGFPGGSYGSALAALQGATTKHGSGAGAEPLIGGQSKSSWLSTIKDLPGKIKDVWAASKRIGSTPWAKEISKAVPSMFRSTVDYADDKIPNKLLPDNPIRGALKSLGIFDNGGVLEPGQLAFNASKKPEAVYNHKQFKQFAEAQAGSGTTSRVAMTITNWRDGTGYFEEIAEQAVDGNARFTAQIGRMG